ncbi:hypothetical protein COLU111180_04110 [Cohnella lubricantis]|uniref:Uncharacterized protein n=1 Tax=Cohnella lubricantis TaxID=2163172 RepID=A0A841TBX1_9BACL|nr:hypothetical protein [Cohnella lubricantis]MBB6676507.1 hypothetical protein [Cohnella lubricantis]MBP2117127.1 hypothetical protein [Cohnella lubricantis]
MSIFGYPAKVTHYHSEVDDWGRPLPPTATEKRAKVVEEQRLIKNAKGEDVQIAYAISLEGVNAVGFDDYIEYVNALGITIRCEVAHIEVRKNLGTDDVKEVVVYGRPQNI